jgi:hypothetical protein
MVRYVDMNYSELKEECENRGIKKYSGLRKPILMLLLMMYDSGLFNAEGVLADERDIYNDGYDESGNSYATILGCKSDDFIDGTYGEDVCEKCLLYLRYCRYNVYPLEYKFELNFLAGSDCEDIDICEYYEQNKNDIDDAELSDILCKKFTFFKDLGFDFNDYRIGDFKEHPKLKK